MILKRVTSSSSCKPLIVFTKTCTCLSFPSYHLVIQTQKQCLYSITVPVIKMSFYQQLIILNGIISHCINICQCHFTFYHIIKKRKIQLSAAAACCHLYNGLHQWILNFLYTISKSIICSSIIIQLFWIKMTGSYDQAISKRKIRILTRAVRSIAKVCSGCSSQYFFIKIFLDAL